MGFCATMDLERGVMFAGGVIGITVCWVLGLDSIWSLLAFPLGYLTLRTILNFWDSRHPIKIPPEFENLWDEGYEEGVRRLKAYYDHDLLNKEDGQ